MRDIKEIGLLETMDSIAYEAGGTVEYAFEDTGILPYPSTTFRYSRMLRQYNADYFVLKSPLKLMHPQHFLQTSMVSMMSL